MRAAAPRVPAAPPSRSRRLAARRPACCAAGADDAAADAAFQQLARAAGVIAPTGPPALRLRTGALGRGVFAARDLSPGEPLLSVPLALCLAAEREAAVAVPGAPWAVLVAGRVPGWPRLQTAWDTYPLPWDVRLALCLLDALDGAAGAPDSPAAATWAAYGALLPPRGGVGSPVALPLAAHAAAQQPELEAEWAADAERVAALCPSLALADDADVASPLHHAVSLARSRAFVAGSVFVVCPFVDMCNTTFSAANAVAALRVAPGQDAAVLAGNGSFDLSVSPNGAGIKAGEEVLISYGVGASTNAALLAKYGFVRTSNPNERLVLQCAPAAPAVDGAALERAAQAAAEAAGGRWMRMRSTDGTLIAALASIPVRQRTARPRPAAEERADAAALRDAAAAALAAAPTTLAEDAQLLAGAAGSSREASLLRLRFERKALQQRTVELLDAYTATLGV